MPRLVGASATAVPRHCLSTPCNFAHTGLKLATPHGIRLNAPEITARLGNSPTWCVFFLPSTLRFDENTHEKGQRWERSVDQGVW